MTGAIQIKRGGEPYDTINHGNLRGKTPSFGAPPTMASTTAWTVRARSAQWHALIASLLMLSTNRVIQIKRGSKLYDTTQQPAGQEAGEECNER
jgi:hypothetical protein